jgi:type I restriction enzyme S subunit
MSFEWKTVKLSEVSKIVSGGTPSTTENSYWDGNIPWITPKDLSGHKDMYVSSGSRSITEAGLKNSSAKLLPRDTVLFTSRAPIGYIAIASQPVCTNQGFKSLVLNDGYDCRFFYYLLKHHTLDIESRATGSTFKEISGASLGSFEVSIPPVNVQKKIADFLSVLDDRITLLKEINETLEDIAQALYKSWFVDFDPVRAKSEGKLFEGMDEATVALFPESFDRGELSEIPKGWTNITIENLCDVVTRGLSPVYKTGSNFFIVNQKVNRGRELDLNALKELSLRMHIPKEKMLNKWDLLVNCLGEGTLGRVHLYKGVSSKYAFDQHMSICRGKPSVSVFLYQILSSTSGQEKIQALKTGSTGMTMFNISKLRQYSIVWPGQLIVNQYFENTKNLFERIAINDNQIRTLSSLLDTLIPRLILGQLRLPELNEINTKTKVNA